jgi:hypothetical protein
LGSRTGFSTSVSSSGPPSTHALIDFGISNALLVRWLAGIAEFIVGSFPKACGKARESGAAASAIEPNIG